MRATGAWRSRRCRVRAMHRAQAMGDSASRRQALPATLDATGAGRGERLRLHRIEALAARMSGLEGRARALLESRLQRLLQDVAPATPDDGSPPPTPAVGSGLAALTQLLAELRVRYEDDTEEALGTDESWQVTRSSLVDSGIYDGEIRDDTLPETPAVSARLWEGEAPGMHDRMSVPVRAHEVFTPRLIRTPAGEKVLDIGQNLAGIFRMRVRLPRGRKMRLLFGEALPDGNFSQENLRSAKAEYVYVSDGKPHELSPCFTYYGFRYVKVEGAEELKPEDFQVLALYSDVPVAGRMRTGHAKINRLISNITWSMKSNFMDTPTDCPQRDERMGWTGDAQIFSETALYLCGAYPFYRKYLFDMSEAQVERNGCVPNTVPPSLGTSAGAVWGDAACIIPWNLYVFTGDRTILEERFESMRAWVEYIRRTDGGDHHWREVYTYGDWLALDSPYPGENQTRGGTDEGFIADVYYRKSALILARAARVLGKEQLAEEYEALGDQILQGIRAEYFSPTGRCCIPTQTAALLTLDEGLHRADRAKQMLRTLLENREDKLATGFVGTAMLCRVLGEHGMALIHDDKEIIGEEVKKRIWSCSGRISDKVP